MTRENIIMLLLAFNTFLVGGVGVKVNDYVVQTEKRLTKIETVQQMIINGRYK